MSDHDHDIDTEPADGIDTREIERLDAEVARLTAEVERLRADMIEATSIIHDLRVKLAEAGVEGSPPPWEATIPRLQRLNDELRAEVARLRECKSTYTGPYN